MRITGWIRTLGLLLIAGAVTLSQQNCSPSALSALTGSSSSDAGVTTPNGNGQPYDGKPYVVPGSCPDGTLVVSRIVLSSSVSGTLVRDHCSEVSIALAPGDFTLSQDQSRIQYGSQTFLSESAPVATPILASWYEQLTGTLQTPSASVYVVDLFSVNASTVSALKSAGHTVLCNFSAGTYETGRPDSSSFAAVDIGNPVSSGSSEKWIDTRSTSIRSIMLARLDLAKSLGCDGVDLDSNDGFENSSGFPLTATTQIDYSHFLAYAAHDRGVNAAMHGAATLAGQLATTFDLVIAEQCVQYGECSLFQPFTNFGKAVFDAEYGPYSASQCSTAKASSISLAYFNSGLDGTRYQPCP